MHFTERDFSLVIHISMKFVTDIPADDRLAMN